MKLKAHEIKVIDMLASNIASSETMNSIKINPIITDFHTTGHGYFLTVTHSDLPSKRIVCDKPIIIGSHNGVESTFLIFIENHELTIECAGMSQIELPGVYRDCDINIYKA